MIFFRVPFPIKNKKRPSFTMSAGAAKEARTLDPQLGKLMLYQLSYCRLL